MMVPGTSSSLVFVLEELQVVNWSRRVHRRLLCSYMEKKEPGEQEQQKKKRQEEEDQSRRDARKAAALFLANPSLAAQVAVSQNKSTVRTNYLLMKRLSGEEASVD